MKNFKQVREKANVVSVEESKHLSYSVKDMKSAELIKNELSSLIKADFEIKKKGSKYIIFIKPKTHQDERVVKSFMDDAKIEMIKDEFVRGIMKSKITNEDISLENSEGEEIVIESKFAEQIMEIHDILNRDNQELFMEMLVHSKETFDQMISFCETYSKKGK